MGEWNAAALGFQQDEDQLGLGRQAFEGRYFIWMLVLLSSRSKEAPPLVAQLGLCLERVNVIIERANYVQRS